MQRTLRLVRHWDAEDLKRRLRAHDRPDRFRRTLFPNDWAYSREDLGRLLGATLERLRYLDCFIGERIASRRNYREWAVLKAQAETLSQVLSCFDDLSRGAASVRFDDSVRFLMPTKGVSSWATTPSVP